MTVLQCLVGIKSVYHINLYSIVIYIILYIEVQSCTCKGIAANPLNTRDDVHSWLLLFA